MRIEIEIPKEFEEHFKNDKFKDSLERIMADIKYSLENGYCLCSGRYEYETIKMLERAVEDSRQAYDIDKVVEELESAENYYYDDKFDEEGDLVMFKSIEQSVAIKIVKQGGASDDVCEWKYNNSEYYWESSCEHLHIFMSDGPEENEYKFCPYCGKKIKVVE